VPSNPFFAVKGKSFYNDTFHNTILATNIAVYQYLADMLFDGDLNRIVWASNDKTFRKRMEQLQKRENPSGTLDIPYASFRLSQDGVTDRASTRPAWVNQTLNTKGMAIDELGRKVKLTPCHLQYESVICFSHDADIYRIQQKLLWDQSNETLLKPILTTKGPEDKEFDIELIAVVDNVPHLNSRFSEADWIVQNKIQAIDMDITVDTWLLEDNYSGYWLSKKVILQFVQDALPEIILSQAVEDEADPLSDYFS
jgi:hypothetical protein